MFGNPETTSGGQALRFYASVRMEIRQSKKSPMSEDVDAPSFSTHTVKIIKNKTAPPFKKTEIDLRTDIGWDVYSNLIDAAATKGIIDKAGTWYSYKDLRLGQGKLNAAHFLKENTDLTDEIYMRITGELIDEPAEPLHEDTTEHIASEDNPTTD